MPLSKGPAARGVAALCFWKRDLVSPAVPGLIFLLTWLLLAPLPVRSAAGPPRPDGAALEEQARQLQRAGQYREALPLALQALQSRYQEKGPEHPDTAASLTMVGLLYLELDSLAEALPVLNRALQSRFQVLGVSHPDTAASLMHLGEVYRRQGALDEARPLLERSAQLRQKILGSDHPETAASLTALALYYQDKGEESQVLPLLERALAIRERTLGQNSPDLAASMNLLGDYHRRRGNYQQALPLLEKAQQIHERTLGKLHPATAQSLSSLGNLYREMGFYVKAQSALEQALQVRQKALGLEHPLAVQSLADLGLLYARQKEFDKARPLLERALAIREQRRPPEHPDLAASYHDLAILQQAMGNLAQAQALAQQALQLRERALGPGHVETLASLSTLAGLYREMGVPAKAVPLYSRILQARENAWGVEHPDLIATLILLAQTHKEAAQPDQTLALWHRIWQIREKASGPEHPDTLASLNTLASLALDLGLYTKALAWYQQVLQIMEKKPGPEHPATAAALTNVARVYQAMGEFDLGLPLLERAVQIQEKALAPEHPDLARTYLDLASLRQARQEFDQALILIQKALKIRKKVFGTEHPETALALAQLAKLSETLGWFASALGLYEQSVTVLTKAKEPSPREMRLIVVRLASLLEAMGESAKALPYWVQAVKLSEQCRDAVPVESDWILASLGFGYLEAGEIKKAEAAFDRIKTREVQIEVALALGRYDEAWQLLEEAPPPMVSSPAFQVRWYTQKGRALAGVGMLPEAAVALWEAVQGAAKLSPRGGDRQQLGAALWWQSRHPQETLLLVLLRLDAQGSPLPPQLQELGPTPRTAAFALAAFVKGQTFLAALSRAPAEITRGELPPEMQLRLRSLNQRLGANESQWERAVKGGKEALSEALATREKLMTELASIQAELASSQPLAAALYFPQPQPVGDVPLASDEVLIEYILGDSDGFILLVRSSEVAYIHPLPLGRSALVDKVRQLLAPVVQDDGEGWSQNDAQELYELLLAKPLATVAPWEKVIIVPDGVLGLLPFEALVVAAGQEARDRVFVGDLRPLVYYPSTAVLTQQRGRPTEPKPRPFLGVGQPWVLTVPAASSADASIQGKFRLLPPLSWTPAGFRALAAHKDWGPITSGSRNEQWLLYPPRPASESLLQGLADLLPKDPEPPDLLLGPQATAANLRRSPLADYRFLHLACSTDCSDVIQGVLQPFLLLGPEAKASLLNGPLTLNAVLALPLGAHLVALENAIIGRGQALAGDGVPHLTRAFLYAGARSVLVNLWPLPATIAQEFYQQVYTSCQNGQSHGRAVFQARQQLRRSHPDPRVWAALQFWGEE